MIETRKKKIWNVVVSTKKKKNCWYMWEWEQREEKIEEEEETMMWYDGLRHDMLAKWTVELSSSNGCTCIYQGDSRVRQSLQCWPHLLAQTVCQIDI